MVSKVQQQLYHLTSDVVVKDVRRGINKNENIISSIADCTCGGNSNLKELNLSVLLRVALSKTFVKTISTGNISSLPVASPVSIFHHFFCQHILLSQVLLNLKHFYLTITNQSDRDTASSDNDSYDGKQQQKLIDKILHDLHVNLGERSKHGQVRQFNLESFGCEISKTGLYDNPAITVVK